MNQSIYSKIKKKLDNELYSIILTLFSGLFKCNMNENTYINYIICTRVEIVLIFKMPLLTILK